MYVYMLTGERNATTHRRRPRPPPRSGSASCAAPAAAAGSWSSRRRSPQQPPPHPRPPPPPRHRQRPWTPGAARGPCPWSLPRPPPCPPSSASSCRPSCLVEMTNGTGQPSQYMVHACEAKSRATGKTHGDGAERAGAAWNDGGPVLLPPPPPPPPMWRDCVASLKSFLISAPERSYVCVKLLFRCVVYFVLRASVSEKTPGEGENQNPTQQHAHTCVALISMTSKPSRCAAA